jgi:hypothetical protein
MDRTSYFYNMHQGTGVAVRALLNDIPFYTGGGAENITVSGPANHLLLPGENVFALELAPAPKPKAAPYLDGVVRFTLRADDDSEAIVHKVAWPEIWEVVRDEEIRVRRAALPPGELDLVPPPDPPLPFLHVSRFRVDDRAPLPAYWDAPRADFGPEGTPAQHEAVREIYRAFQSGDPDRFLDAHALKLEERQRAYPGVTEMSRDYQRNEIAEHFKDRWQVRPTEMSELVFERRADGRVAYVHRLDGGYALEALSDAPEDNVFATDLYLTQQNGVWRVFR